MDRQRKAQLQIAVIALVVVDDVILDAVRVEALRLPLGVQGQGHRAGDGPCPPAM